MGLGATLPAIINIIIIATKPDREVISNRNNQYNHHSNIIIHSFETWSRVISYITLSMQLYNCYGYNKTIYLLILHINYFNLKLSNEKILDMTILTKVSNYKNHF